MDSFSAPFFFKRPEENRLFSLGKFPPVQYPKTRVPNFTMPWIFYP